MAAAQAKAALDLVRKAEVQSVIDRGDAHPSQCNGAGGHITYEFIGGRFDGVSVRLYPPFEPRISLDGGDEWYFIGPPKGRAAQLTYRLEGAPTP